MGLPPGREPQPVGARPARVRPGESHRGTVNVLDAALAAGARARAAHQHRKHLDQVDTPTARSMKISRFALTTRSARIVCRSCWPSSTHFRWPGPGKPVVVANPTMPVGPGDRGLSPPTRLILDFCARTTPRDHGLHPQPDRRARRRVRAYSGDGARNAGRRYLLGHANLTLRELLGLLSELTGVASPRLRVSYPVALAAAWLSELVADHLTGRAPKATMTGVRLARRLMHFDATRTLSELGLQPRSIRSSLADAIDWLREQGHLLPV